MEEVLLKLEHKARSMKRTLLDTYDPVPVVLDIP